VRSSASLNSASAPRRELFLPSHLALRHHRGSMLNFLALPQGDGATIELGADWRGQVRLVLLLPALSSISTRRE
jgi:hypothetical protein